MNIISKLALGQDLLVNQNFSNDFALILQPFSNTTIISSDRAIIRDQNTGLLWTKLDDMCWYDAADIARGNEPCGNSDGYSYSTQSVIAYSRRTDVSRGCKRTLGLAWSLPTNRQLFSTKNGPSGHLESWTREGSHYIFVYGNPAHQIGDQWVDRPKLNSHFGNYNYDPYSYDKKLSDTTTYCVAKASDVEPDSDLDGDGIPNRLDKCNRLPND